MSRTLTNALRTSCLLLLAVALSVPLPAAASPGGTPVDLQLQPTDSRDSLVIAPKFFAAPDGGIADDYIVTLADGVPGVSSGLFQQVKIEYDTGTGIATVTLNGLQVLSQAVSAGGITQAAFHLHIPSGNDQIDDFEVTWEP